MQIMAEEKWIQKAVKALKAEDPVLSAIIEDIGECMLKPSKDYFGALARSIIYQQLSRHAATAIYNKFLERNGGSLTPDSVLTIKHEDFKASGISERKASYLMDLALKFKNGQIDFSRVEELSDEEIIEKLISVKGIGVWSAQMLLIFSMNRPDILPLGDAGFRRAVKISYGFEQNPSDEEVIRIAEAWRPYRSIASWYMWQTVNK